MSVVHHPRMMHEEEPYTYFKVFLMVTTSTNVLKQHQQNEFVCIKKLN